MTTGSVIIRDGVVRKQSFSPVGPGTGRCLTVVDRPRHDRPVATVVIAHGLTGDRAGPAELLSGLSAELCRGLGLLVVRFDFQGAGDSSGEFESMTFERMTADFVELTTRHAAPGRPVICSGISIGGVPAVLAARELQRRGTIDVRGLVLMSSDLVEGIRFVTAGPTAIRGGEFHLPETFFREREELKPRTVLAGLGLPFTLIHGAEDAKVAEAARWFAAHGGQVAPIEGDHLFQSVSARRSLARAWTTFAHRLAIQGSEEVR